MEREPIINECIDCGHMMTGPEPGPTTCSVYLIPSSKWRIGNCPMATHIKKEPIRVAKLNPMKASKRNIKT